jgi:hypothetical protein
MTGPCVSRRKSGQQAKQNGGGLSDASVSSDIAACLPAGAAALILCENIVSRKGAKAQSEDARK